jgi:hypothetical protein
VPDDCPGQVCCAHVTVTGQPPQSRYTGISCAASCPANGDEFLVCSLADPTVCPPNQQCVMSGVLGKNYYICN